jgi:hypothetical protein
MVKQLLNLNTNKVFYRPHYRIFTDHITEFLQTTLEYALHILTGLEKL